MTELEISTHSSGNISLMDRAIRVVLGFSVLIGAMYLSIDTGAAYPWVKIFATIVVLTGIAGWDPLYATFRRIAHSLGYGESIPKQSITVS